MDDRSYQIELEKLELGRRRFALEESKANERESVFRRHLGVLLTFAVSIATVILSGTQVYIAQQKNISDKRVAEIERDRKWQLDIANFITKNSGAIFDGSPEQKVRMRQIIQTTFSDEIADAVFKKLGQTTDKNSKDIWLGKIENLAKIVEKQKKLLEETFNVSIFELNKRIYYRVKPIQPRDVSDSKVRLNFILQSNEPGISLIKQKFLSSHKQTKNYIDFEITNMSNDLLDMAKPLEIRDLNQVIKTHTARARLGAILSLESVENTRHIRLPDLEYSFTRTKITPAN